MILGDLAIVVDCEHKTAPPASLGEEFGYSIGTPDLRGGRMQLATAKRVSREVFDLWTRRAVPSRGDLILAREAPVGQVAYVDGGHPVCLGQRTVLIQIDTTRAEPRFLHFRLLAPDIQAWMQDRSSGSTVAHLNVADVRQIPLPQLPRLDEQRRIAGVLGAFDNLIDTNERLVSSLREQVTSHFLKMMRTEPLESRPFFSVYEVDFGAPFSGDHFTTSGKGMPLLRIRDLKKMTSDVWTAERLPGDVVIVPGDIVVGMDAEFRATLWLGDPSLLNQRVCRVRAHLGGSAWVRESLVGPLAFIEGHKTGTTVAHLNKRDLTETRITVPPEDAVRTFSTAADPMFAAIVDLARESRSLSHVRDELLPLLMSGRITVDEAWEAVPG